MQTESRFFAQPQSWRSFIFTLLVTLSLLAAARPAAAADGRIVVCHDEWILSDAGFSAVPLDAAQYARNLTSWLTRGKPNAKILAYSHNFGYTGVQLAATMNLAGYTWVVSDTVPTDLASLLQYDAIYLGDSFFDNATLVDYVRTGRSVYVVAGTGLNFPNEAGAWNPFINTFGLRYINGGSTDGTDSVYNEISAVLPIVSEHPIFNNVNALFHNNGNTVEEISPTSASTSIILYYQSSGLIGVYEPESTSDKWPIDIAPGMSPNLLSTARHLPVTAISINGGPGRDVTLIDPATVRVLGLAPLSNAVADVSSPYAPFTGRTDINAGIGANADGSPDLVLYFDTAALLGLLAPVTDGQAVSVPLTANYFAGPAINGDDLVITMARLPGSIIVGHDDWVFSDYGHLYAPDCGKLLRNISSYFAGGGQGQFLFSDYSVPYENQFGLTMLLAGHSLTPAFGAVAPGSLSSLMDYDGLFLGGNVDDQSTLINYVLSGGNVYLAAGFPDSGDAQRYNTFLNYFGLSLGTTFNSFVEVNPVTSTNVLFAGVNTLYTQQGSQMSLINPANPETIELARNDGTLTFMQYKPLPNRVPIVEPDFATTQEGVSVTIPVLANDVDPEGQAFGLTGVTQPAAGGSAQVSGSEVLFIPAPGFNGTVTFNYLVEDSFGGASSGLVTVVVTPAPLPVNHAPVANNGSYTIAQNASLTGTVIATDPDGNGLTYSVATPPSSGTLMFSATGEFTYTPALNFTGTVTFQFLASDGSLSATGTVTVTVNAITPVNLPPVAVNDTATVAQGGTVTINALANDSDPDGDALSITTATSANGTVVISSGKLVFTPNASFNGTATISYTISDGKGGTATATVTVTVTATPTLGCDVYPIALSWNNVRAVNPGQIITDIYNGNKPGNFGWLTWAGSPSTPTLVTSLGIPGNSYTYINPFQPSDHRVSVGDWVQGSPGVANSSHVRAALDLLKTIDIVVPVFDTSRAQGNNALFHVVAFAKVRIQSYQLPKTNKITVKFLGLVDCNCN
jgi:hypothetical protein